MNNRRRIEEKVSRKEQEIQELEMKLREARSYIQALQDVMKLMPRDDSESVASQPGTATLRAGSHVSEARSAILKAGRPMHIVEILKAIGRPNDRKTKLAMAGSLATYVRRHEVFTRPKPNTFSLVELDAKTAAPTATARASPPENFGLDEGDK